VCQSEGVPLPLKPRLVNKIADINNLVNRTWTEAELQEKLKRSGVLSTKTLPIERNRINNLIKEAKNRGDEDAVARLRDELATLEGPKLAHGTSLSAAAKKPSSGGLSQQERLAVLNKANRKKNIEEIRQAQINERRAAKMTEAALARGEVVAEDHSRRVKTRAKFKHDVSEGVKKTDTDRSGSNTPAIGTPTSSAKVVTSSLPPIVKVQGNGEQKGLPGIRRPLVDDDIIGSIDLGIEIEL
jgi:RNA polymerase-associated protein RTF1